MNDENMLLIGEALNGSEDAYSRLYDILKPRAVSVAFKYLRVSGCEAQEFGHDATAKVLMNLDKFAGDAQFTTWATTVINNQALQVLRRGRSRGSKADMVYLDAPLAEGGITLELKDPVDHGAAAEARRDVEIVMSQVSDPGLLWDALGEGMTAPELAAKYGASQAVVKSRIYRLRKEGVKIMTENAQPASIQPVRRTCKCGCNTPISARGWPYAKGHSPERAPRPEIQKSPSSIAVESVKVEIVITATQAQSFWNSLTLQQKANLMVNTMKA